MGRRLASASVAGHVLLAAYALNLFFGFVSLCNSLKIVYYFASWERIVNLTFFSQAVDQSVWLLSLSAIIFFLILLTLHRRDRLPRSIILIQSIYLLALASQLLGQENIALTIAILTSIATLIGVLACAERLFEIPRRTALVLFLTYLLLPLIAIEIGSAIALIMNPFHPAEPIRSDLAWLLPPVETNSWIHLETEISNIAYPATPYLMLLSLYSWALMPMAKKLRERIAKSKTLRRTGLKCNSSIEVESPTFTRRYAEGGLHRIRLARIKSFLIVGCAIMVGGFLVLSPYISQSRFVGVDTHTYNTLLSKMTDPEDARKIILEDEVAGPKAMYFLLLYLIKTLTGLSAMAVVKVAVVVPSSLLAISAYLLVRYGSRNDSLATLSSLLAVLSFNTTVSMFAGIYANWLALSFMMLSFALLIKASTQNSRKILIASIVTSSLVLLTHVLSSIVFMAVLCFYSATSLLALHFWKKAETRRDFLFSLSILLANGVFTLFLLGLSNLFSINLSAKLAVWYVSHSPILGADSLSRFSQHLTLTLTEYVAGFLANPLIYFLAIVGALRGSYRRSFERLLHSWLMPTSIVIPLITSLDQWRILYSMPFQILAALGIFQLTKRAGLLLPNEASRERETISKLFKGSLLCLIILSLFNYTARSINLLFLLFRP